MWSPRWWTDLQEEGAAPDPRMTFANERTFLAWIRTALALIAGGLGVEAFAHDLPEWARSAIAIALVVVGGLLGASAFRRWLSAELALRRNEPLPPSRTPQLVSLAIAAVALAVALIIAFD
ncbi:MAG: YidH family protein [Aquihabitans sp.]